MKDMASERRAARQQPYPPPPQAEKLPCPRCESTNTKFCYYNNYNPSQPRHYCKACRRYWTQGGSLRNIPVGGGTRKRPRPSAHVSAMSSEISLDDSTVSSFASLLTSEGAASFMGGYEVGPTTAFDDSRGIWSFPEEASGWQLNGECFPWPEPASRTQLEL